VRHGLNTLTSRRSSTNFRGSSSCSPKLSRTAPTFLCSHATSISSAAGTTLQTIRPATADRPLSRHTNSYLIRSALTLTPANYGLITSNCIRRVLVFLVVPTGKICRRWTPCARYTNGRYRFQLERPWKYGETTIDSRWASTRLRYATSRHVPQISKLIR
jgi:hypothetical protein